MGPPAFTLPVTHPSDTETEHAITTALADLLDGRTDAAMAARAIDQAIVMDCDEALESYTSADEAGDGGARAPRPAGWQRRLWRHLCDAAVAAPPEGADQDRLVGLVRELRRLPRRAVPWLAAGTLTEMPALWDLSAANGYGGFEQSLWELDQGSFTGHQQVETDPRAAAAYVSLSAFEARLLAAGAVDTTRLSALVRPSPFASGAPRPADGDAARRHEPYAAAAAQWILHAGGALREMCDGRVLVEVGRQRWTGALWDVWRAGFEAVVTGGELFSAPARELAARAVARMDELEGQDVLTDGVVRKFGFISVREEDDEDENEDGDEEE